MTNTIWDKLAPSQRNEIKNLALSIDIELDEFESTLRRQQSSIKVLREISIQLRSFSDTKLAYLIGDAIKLGETVTIVCNGKKAKGELKKLYGYIDNVFCIVGWDSKYASSNNLYPRHGVRFGLSQIVRIDNENNKLVLFLEQKSDNKDALGTNIGSQIRTYNKSLKRMIATRIKPVEAVKKPPKLLIPPREFVPVNDKFTVFKISNLQVIAEFYDYEQACKYAKGIKELGVINSDYFQELLNEVIRQKSQPKEKIKNPFDFARVDLSDFGIRDEY